MTAPTRTGRITEGIVVGVAVAIITMLIVGAVKAISLRTDRTRHEEPAYVVIADGSVAVGPFTVERIRMASEGRQSAANGASMTRWRLEAVVTNQSDAAARTDIPVVAEVVHGRHPGSYKGPPGLLSPSQSLSIRIAFLLPTGQLPRALHLGDPSTPPVLLHLRN